MPSRNLVNTTGYLPLFAGADVIRLRGPRGAHPGLPGVQYPPGALMPYIAPLVFTSRPYPYVYREGIDLPLSNVVYGNMYMPPQPVDNLDVGLANIIAGSLDSTLRAYNNWPPEAIDVGVANVIAGTIESGYQAYTNWPAEAIDVGVANVIAGTIANGLVTYSNYIPEAIDVGVANVIAGTLT